MALCSKNDVTMRVWVEGGGSKGPKTRVCVLLILTGRLYLLDRQFSVKCCARLPFIVYRWFIFDWGALLRSGRLYWGV